MPSNSLSHFLGTLTQLADYDRDILSRKDYLRQYNGAFTTDLAYDADDDLNSIVHSAPRALTLTVGHNNSGQIIASGLRDILFGLRRF